MACDCDCQMLKTINYLIRKNQELEQRVLALENKSFIDMMARRDLYHDEPECDCGCNSMK